MKYNIVKINQCDPNISEHKWSYPIGAQVNYTPYDDLNAAFRRCQREHELPPYCDCKYTVVEAKE